KPPAPCRRIPPERQLTAVSFRRGGQQRDRPSRRGGASCRDPFRPCASTFVPCGQPSQSTYRRWFASAPSQRDRRSWRHWLSVRRGMLSSCPRRPSCPPYVVCACPPSCDGARRPWQAEAEVPVAARSAPRGERAE